MSAAKRYTEEQMRKQVLEAFRIGLAIGERRAIGGGQVATTDTSGAGAGSVARGHLTLIRGGAA